MPGPLIPLSNASSPTPQFRLFIDDGTLWIEGDVTAAALDQARRALDDVPWVSQVIVDLATTSFMTSALKAGLRDLTETGANVAVLGDTSTERSMP